MSKYPYGNARKLGGETEISGTPAQLAAWADRPGNRWPCSELARLGSKVFVRFDSRGDLVDCSENVREIDGAEFYAWTSDVLCAAFGMGNQGGRMKMDRRDPSDPRWVESAAEQIHAREREWDRMDAELDLRHCPECSGKGWLVRLGGDWGKTPDTEVVCWACRGQGIVARR